MTAMSLMKHILPLLIALTLASCASSQLAPGDQQIVANAETNPSPNAIVGMWHTEYKLAFGKYDILHYSILFRADGTGLYKVQNNRESWGSQIVGSKKANPLT